jgi:uncharacterized protein YecT (DUF1311 family)
MNRRRALIALVSCASLLLTALHPLRASELGKEMNDADAKLNTVYQKVIKGLPNDAAREKLKAAQRAWVAWRDAEVKTSQSIYEDGKTGLFMMLSLTQQRIKQLEAIGQRESEYGYDEKQQ